jgi:hypothetical protein
METIGNALSSVGGALPSFLGGPQIQQYGQSIIPPSAGEIGGAMQYSPDPSVSSYFGTTPDPTSTPEGFAGPIATALGPTGGVGANPAQLTESAFTALPQATDPVTGGALGPALGDPASSLTGGILSALGLGGGGGGAAGGTGGTAGTAGQPSLLGSILKMGPGAIEGLLKYQQQQSLLDPSSLSSASKAITNAQAAQLRKAVMPQVTAQGQETGQINAPYLMNQAYTTAIAPILAQMQEAAMNQWLEANRLAGGLYPSEGALGGLVNPSIFGGSS